MASEIIMKAPICLVENWNQQLKVNPKALDILNKISQPVMVVGIVGLYRTGKSYLMNRLAGQNNGFPLGSTVRSETKGIWMWCVPHPLKPNHTVVLLDTEGLGDVEKGDPKNDLWIFALTVLLSSTLVYNSLGIIDNQALEQLHFVTELTEFIRTRSSPISDEVEDSAEFVSFFPDFVWAVRDFTLELILDGHPITEDEYLENALKSIPEGNPGIQNSNKSRTCIKYFFPRRKCFVFSWPISNKKQLAHLDKVSEDQLEPDFKNQSEKFRSHIFTIGETKTLRQGIIVTGNRLGSLVGMYVDAINSGAVPCLEDAVTTLAERENTKAVQKAADHYTAQMAQRVAFPTDTLQELLDVHTACEKEAIEIFMDHSFKDDNFEFQHKLEEAIEKKKGDVLLQNEEASLKYCQAELRRLSEPLVESVSRGTFFVPGGHSLYLEARKKVEQEYELVPRKGVKANEVLQGFLQSQAATEKSILQADKALTDAQKALAAEEAKRQAAEKERELLRQKEKEQQQKMEAQEKSFRENITQMQKRIKEIKAHRREQEKMLEHKLKVKEEMLKEGHEEHVNKLGKEINWLKEEILKRDKEIVKQENLKWISMAIVIAVLGTASIAVTRNPATLRTIIDIANKLMG
ncbi:guanylate-binding protein 4-like isoform X1 [Ochotona curzoniae]|uniref:guanylate-binding protein 4-like isoform X1 n=1 Tax=Ochotona curzoniae TaxID=130825 RepID=UPI001B34EE37|nr:guanylate-binding protein 4-like isoform X1 [Ochotona curzoniae]